ncbi:MAG: DUF1350 domain-containing protein [Leptolyngbya sp. SIO3F4]|nr:DUF1350 domain-containing protein [Leptolyngbya sp. SIO3F4]
MVLSLPSAPQFQFLPCSHSWVALHPRPKGVIQFIGTKILGLLPTVAYHHFLKSLFEDGYTVVAIPFRFTFDHWSVTLDLLGEHYAVRGAMIETAVASGYSPDIYLDPANYAWIGHGLGCKYVTLLELVSSPIDVLKKHFQALGQGLALQRRQTRCLENGLADIQKSLHSLEKRIHQLTGHAVAYGQPSIKDEVSLLLAPVMTDLDGAIPLKPLEKLLGNFIKVHPTVEQTHWLVEQSHLFHLTGLLQFARDRIAVGTCHELMQRQPHIRRRLLKGNHLEVIGLQVGLCVVDLNPFDKFIQPLRYRDLESKTLTLLTRLRHAPSTVPLKTGGNLRRRRSIAA